ncbi:F-box only protein 47 isoform X2 [Hyperolius riggenbachi]
MALPCSSFTLIPNQKFKRNNRCIKVPAVSTESSDASPLGHFQVLPLEIFYILLEYLHVKDISLMSITSKAISGHLISYISSPAGSHRLLRQDFHHADVVDGRRNTPVVEYYKALGLLYKRCTLLMPTRERLKYIRTIVSKVPCFKLNGCSSPSKCLGLLCYGAFLKILTAGWDELECNRVYTFICDSTDLQRKVQSLVGSKPGKSRKLEVRVRFFCRNVLLDHWTENNDIAFWLTRLLKPWPMVNQAQLLYIIFGPVNDENGQVAWLKMVEGAADENSLKGIADALKLLYTTESKEWTTDAVISLLDELSVCPHEWHMENNARLLILSGNRICFTFMASKAVNRRTVELAKLIVFLALVCEKDSYCMEWAVKMIQRVSKLFGTQQDRRSFMQNVENSFVGVIMSMVQSVGRNEDDSTFLDLFHLVNAQANLHKEILYLTLTSSSA